MKTEWTELMFMQYQGGQYKLIVFAGCDVRLPGPGRPCTRAGPLPLGSHLVVRLRLCSLDAAVPHQSVNIFVQDSAWCCPVGLACRTPSSHCRVCPV